MEQILLYNIMLVYVKHINYQFYAVAIILLHIAETDQKTDFFLCC